MVTILSILFVIVLVFLLTISYMFLFKKHFAYYINSYIALRYTQRHDLTSTYEVNYVAATTACNNCKIELNNKKFSLIYNYKVLFEYDKFSNKHSGLLSINQFEQLLIDLKTSQNLSETMIKYINQ